MSAPAAWCAFADGVTGQHAQPPHHLQELEAWWLEVTPLTVLSSVSLFPDPQENSVWSAKSHPGFWRPAARKHYSCQYIWLARPGKGRRHCLEHSSPVLFLLSNGQALSSALTKSVLLHSACRVFSAHRHWPGHAGILQSFATWAFPQRCFLFQAMPFLLVSSTLAIRLNPGALKTLLNCGRLGQNKQGVLTLWWFRLRFLSMMVTRRKYFRSAL